MSNNLDLENIKKAIKLENCNQRLQSLKPPRNLNLGGTKPAKKQFVPNVSVARNKNKIKEVTNVNKQKNKDKYLITKKQTTNVDRYIQSSGVFADGIGSDIKRSSRWASSRSEREPHDSSSIPVPTIKKDEDQIIDQKVEEDILNQIMENDEEEIEEQGLPFEPITWHNKNFKTRDHDMPLKSETTPYVSSTLEKLKLTTDEIHDTDLYSNNKPSVTLWKLPDSFAKKMYVDDADSGIQPDCCLKNLNEGKIGKLLIRKSGKVEVHIGYTKYCLEPSDLETYTEQVVALDVDKEKKLGTAIVLHDIKNRMILNPDWDSLL